MNIKLHSKCRALHLKYYNKVTAFVLADMEANVKFNGVGLHALAK
jgi:hypothetical protein